MNNVSLNYCSLIANKPQHRISSTVSFVKIFHVSPFLFLLLSTVTEQSEHTLERRIRIQRHEEE